jgi:hypothetical protein
MPDEKTVVAVEGLTLRDWFAGQALSGLLAHHGATDMEMEARIRRAYVVADAVLSYRRTQGGTPSQG